MSRGTKNFLNHLIGISKSRLKLFLRFADVVRVLLENGADTEVQNAQGETPLISATQIQYIRIGTIRSLLDYGADVGKRDKKGTSNEGYEYLWKNAFLKNYLYLAFII